MDKDQRGRATGAWNSTAGTVVTMAHGSGGQSSNELIEGIFKKAFANANLDRLEDAAVLEFSSENETGSGGRCFIRLAFTTDSFVVDPPDFPGGDIGKLAVCGTANDLLMMGAEPLFLSCGCILEEGLPIDRLQIYVDHMAREARRYGIAIVAGDTKVVGRGSVGGGDRNVPAGLFINTSGIGRIVLDGLGVEQVQPGDAVLLNGSLGQHHAAILSRRLELENDIQSDCAVLKEMVMAFARERIKVRMMRDVTRGGLATILNEIAAAAKKTISLRETAIPVDPVVAGFCDILGLDPLYMGNEGKMIAIVAEEDADRALALMRAAEFGSQAAKIGRVERGEPTVQLTTRLGSRRFLDVLYGEGLPRIC